MFSKEERKRGKKKERVRGDEPMIRCADSPAFRPIQKPQPSTAHRLLNSIRFQITHIHIYIHVKDGLYIFPIKIGMKLKRKNKQRIESERENGKKRVIRDVLKEQGRRIFCKREREKIKINKM